MDGYWGAEEKTRVTIDGDGWVHTGDLGYLDDDNYLFLSGRTGDMIIRGGENIAPEEVEAVLYELTNRDLYRLYQDDLKAYVLVLQNINRVLCRRLRRATARITEQEQAASLLQR